MSKQSIQQIKVHLSYKLVDFPSSQGNLLLFAKSSSTKNTPITRIQTTQGPKESFKKNLEAEQQEVDEAKTREVKLQVLCQNSTATMSKAGLLWFVAITIEVLLWLEESAEFRDDFFVQGNPIQKSTIPPYLC